MTNIYNEVANVYFFPGDSSKKPGGVLANCLDRDAMVNGKGMDGTGLRMSKYLRTDPRLWEGACFWKSNCTSPGLFLVVKIKLQLSMTSHNTFYSDMKASPFGILL